MSDPTEDLDALFEEMAAQHRSETSTPVASSPAAHVEEPITVDTVAEVVSALPRPAFDASAERPAMYDSVGHIVRQLHDSLRELGYDRSLSEISSDVTDAASRLEYIATLTEQAANKVLNSIDEAMPVQDEMMRKGADIEKRWAALFEGKLSVDEFKALAHESHGLARSVVETGEAEKARLMQIMMAQDFQDITGQIIKKIVGITQNMERELAQLLLDNAPASAKAAKEKVVDLMAGPSVPASAMVQNDVDDLLADLGF